MAVRSPAPPDANLGWLLSQASHVLKTRFTAALEDVGISPRVFHVLKTAASGEFTQTELAQAVGLDKTTMTVTMDHLEEAGLAERTPSSTDRRARVISVTKAGRKKIDEAKAIVDRVNDEVLESFPADQREAFMLALCTLAGGEPAHCSQPVRRRG